MLPAPRHRATTRITDKELRAKLLQMSWPNASTAEADLRRKRINLDKLGLMLAAGLDSASWTVIIRTRVRLNSAGDQGK